MNEIGYLIAKIKYKIKNGDKEVVNNYFRNAGIKIGENCTICCNIMSAEPYLIEIGNYVTISGNVVFVTHDNSVSKFFGGGMTFMAELLSVTTALLVKTRPLCME